jgi:hypothetical protein
MRSSNFRDTLTGSANDSSVSTARVHCQPSTSAPSRIYRQQQLAPSKHPLWTFCTNSHCSPQSPTDDLHLFDPVSARTSDACDAISYLLWSHHQTTTAPAASSSIVHQIALSKSCSHIPYMLLATQHASSKPSRASSQHKMFTVDALLNLVFLKRIRTRYGIHLADHDRSRPPKERDWFPSLTENSALCTHLPQVDRSRLQFYATICRISRRFSEGCLSEEESVLEGLLMRL